MTDNLTKNKTVSVFTLGCKTNLYESQQIVANLNKVGYKADFGLIWADIFIINTCAVTAEAESKSRQAIARVRKINPDASIVMVGCAVDKNAEQFLKKDGVTAVISNAEKGRIAEIIDKIDVTSPKRFACDFPTQYLDYGNALPSHTRAFVKIQDGCNNFCSYCIVPYLRGRSRSRSIESIVDEIKNNPSANEFVLIGIDISQYGRDIDVSLADLLNALSFTSARIRLGSIYQDCVDIPLLDAMKNTCKHLHLSLQSGCDNTLLSMNRHYTTAQFADTVALIRSKYPDTAITTDIIVGFCGETDEDFDTTCAFAEQMRFADIHVFPYSARQGTAAYGKSTPDPLAVAARVKRLTEIKHRLHAEFLSKYIGSQMQILTEEYKNGYTSGYTDNYVKVYVKQRLPINAFIDVKLSGYCFDGVSAQLSNKGEN